ncbi:unnamed protein product [Acanthoscelides obtectus]|uniref:Uncharacterized protein n=1 Tax=Acanthoscelides obtectus TaxID=200917 RepID=A0A9P0LXP1_ACAOB|nr:unnamed protein product [Acanthoscelides obtectus]CAK1678434.1 hypothetical protein AOBTE_LOCUS31901 [Acanthoscelides obtectus]
MLQKYHRCVLASDNQRIDKEDPHTSIELSQPNIVPLEPPIQITPPKRPDILCEFPEKETTKILAKVHPVPKLPVLQEKTESCYFDVARKYTKTENY